MVRVKDLPEEVQEVFVEDRGMDLEDEIDSSDSFLAFDAWLTWNGIIGWTERIKRVHDELEDLYKS